MQQMTAGSESQGGIGVAEAKRRFSELLDHVAAGERVVVERRGRPAAVLVPPTPDALQAPANAPLGLAAVAGALADWDDLEAVVDDIYQGRREATDRPPPDVG
jgi:prevent-host-death family protein